jgi:hypothetical protein
VEAASFGACPQPAITAAQDINRKTMRMLSPLDNAVWGKTGSETVARVAKVSLTPLLAEISQTHLHAVSETCQFVIAGLQASEHLGCIHSQRAARLRKINQRRIQADHKDVFFGCHGSLKRFVEGLETRNK